MATLAGTPIFVTGRRLPGRAVLGILVLLASACDREPGRPVRAGVPVIAFLGDSITYGYTRGARAGEDPVVDPEGGYPARLAVRLDGRARILNRGIGGATTGFWLAAPGTRIGEAMWTLVRRAPWFEPSLEPGGASVALAVIMPARPDVVVVLLGVNDLHFARRHPDDAVATTVEGLTRLVRELGPVAGRVLVATPLPNRRDPPALLRALGVRIHATFPEALPIGERFAALDWPALLGDDIHPTPEGYARLARILERLLVERGIVAGAPAGQARAEPDPAWFAAGPMRAYHDPP